MTKEKLQGAAEAIIALNQNLDSRLNVSANVYENVLGNCLDVTIYWYSYYNVDIEEQEREYKNFNNITDFNQFCIDVETLCHDLEKVEYNDHYSPSKERKEILDEARGEYLFESNRGN